MATVLQLGDRGLALGHSGQVRPPALDPVSEFPWCPLVSDLADSSRPQQRRTSHSALPPGLKQLPTRPLQGHGARDTRPRTRGLRGRTGHF